ncbi:MAG TPA: cytochrome b/b6 domain-containing protein [Rubrivivax sp.]|jgi:cytochrome b|nr:cytochrome b/b6 domain-containing protein [Rubrivivax sp.]
MHTSPAHQPSAAEWAQPGSTAQRRVIDAPTRMFHWLFALSFVGAYLTADGERWRALHVTLGYTLAGLLALRVLYGLVGPRHARLGLLLRKLASAPAWLRSLPQGIRHGTAQRIQWRQGQNLAMALAVLALLLLVVPLTLSGYGTYNDWGDWLGGDWLEDVHEFLGNAFLAVVLGHIALIAGLSLLRRRNQALPMLTGRIEGAGPDLVKRNNAWLAVLLLATVLAFVGWEWQQAPQGRFLVPGSAQTSSDRHDDDDD